MQDLKLSLGWVYNDFMKDQFIASYIETAVKAPPLNPLSFSVADLAVSAIERMVEDCKLFKAQNLSLMTLPGAALNVTLAKAGIDFWHVRSASRTATFPISYWRVPNGPLLTKAALELGPCHLFVGGDGLLYVSSQDR
jgi:hypothetical protein